MPENAEGFIIEDEIFRMVGIIDTNAHEIHTRIGWSYKGVYPLGAILSHGCIINSRHVIEKESPFYNHCRATVLIPKGMQKYQPFLLIFRNKDTYLSIVDSMFEQNF